MHPSFAFLRNQSCWSYSGQWMRRGSCWCFKPGLIDEDGQRVYDSVSIADHIRKITLELGICPPVQAERLTDLLEGRHGSGKMSEIRQSLEAHVSQSPYLKEILPDLPNFRVSSNVAQSINRIGGEESIFRTFSWSGVRRYRCAHSGFLSPMLFFGQQPSTSHYSSSFTTPTGLTEFRLSGGKNFFSMHSDGIF